MRQYCLIALVSCGLLFSCKNEPKSNPAGPTVQHLTATTVYQFDSVVAFLRGMRASQRDSGTKVFLQAIDMLKNKKDAAGSVALFERSLQFYPNNKGYYELGNALLETNDDDKALTAFDLAERLNYDPLGHVLFKKACAAAGSAGDDWDKQSTALQYLKDAIENGFADRDKIFNEPKLAQLRTRGDFISIYNSAMSGNGDPATILWDGFNNGFKPCSFPLTIDMNALKGLEQLPSISYEYEKFVTEMRDYKFSRDVGNEFFYYAMVMNDPNFKTLIYGSRSYDMGDSMPYVPARFYLASYDRKGKLIDKLELAGQAAYDQLFKVAVLQQNGSFQVKDFKNTWAKPIEDNGYQNNSIVKTELMKTTNYKILPDGKFQSDAKLLGIIDVQDLRSRSLQ